MTYEQIATEIALMSPEQRKMDATVYLTGMVEVIPIRELTFATDDIADILDVDHPIFVVEW